MGCDRLRFDQGYVVNEQAYDAFALPGINARVIPDLRQLFGETENTSASLGTKSQLKTVSNVVLPGWACLRTGEVQPKGGMAGMEEWPVPVFDTRLKLIEPCLSNSISRAGSTDPAIKIDGTFGGSQPRCEADQCRLDQNATADLKLAA